MHSNSVLQIVPEACAQDWFSGCVTDGFAWKPVPLAVLHKFMILLRELGKKDRKTPGRLPVASHGNHMHGGTGSQSLTVRLSNLSV